jgi:hypothetical protein
VDDHTIVLPQTAKHQIDIVLAAVAGALLVLVLITARGVIAGTSHAPTAPQTTAITTEQPTAAPVLAPVNGAQGNGKKGGKGKD